MRGINRYIEDLLRGRRPRDFLASPDEATLARTAITLRSARPGSGAPTEEFVTGLHKRLAAEIEDRRPEPHVPGRPRRAFMRAATAAAAIATGTVIGRLLTARTAHTAVPPGGAIVPDEGRWQAVLTSADLPDGAVRPFTMSALTGFVERTGGRLRAVSGTCTHQGCRLSLAEPPTQLECPCHGAVFALDGTVIRHQLSIDLTALPRISVRESGGVVQVLAPGPQPPGRSRPDRADRAESPEERGVLHLCRRGRGRAAGAQPCG
jgi:cytochrome b6-f complex iron-sulfur subunit